MKHVIATALIATALAAPASAERTFICQEDAAVGFIFENRRWQPATFNPKERYLVTIDGSAFRVQEFGGYDFLGDCSGYQRGGHCNGYTGNFVFRMDTLRYVETYAMGYSGGDSETDTPMVSIGTCAEM